MAKPNLTAQDVRNVLAYDPTSGIFTWILTKRRTDRLGKTAGGLCSGYIVIKINRVNYGAHRLAWLYMTGEWPLDMLDHIDGNRANNCFSNLRQATNALNQQNKRGAYRTNKTGFLGVSWSKSMRAFEACLSVNRKTVHIGLFETPEEAHEAYLKAKREGHAFCTI